MVCSSSTFRLVKSRIVDLRHVREQQIELQNLRLLCSIGKLPVSSASFGKYLRRACETLKLYQNDDAAYKFRAQVKDTTQDVLSMNFTRIRKVSCIVIAILHQSILARDTQPRKKIFCFFGPSSTCQRVKVQPPHFLLFLPSTHPFLLPPFHLSLQLLSHSSLLLSTAHKHRTLTLYLLHPSTTTQACHNVITSSSWSRLSTDLEFQ
jgi:hypothetical protein